MTCPLEKQFVALLDVADIPFTRPERTPADPTTLDFYLPTIGLYVEVKRWHSDRIASQLSKLSPNAAAIVLVGPQSVEKFAALVKRLSA